MIPVVLLANGTSGPVLGEPACVGGGVRRWRCCRRPSPICSISPSSRAAGATNASLVTLIVPVSAILLGALFLGERLELFEFAGMALIAIGLVTIDGRLLQARRRPAIRPACPAKFFHSPSRAISTSETSPKARMRVGFPTIMSHCSTFSACQRQE